MNEIDLIAGLKKGEEAALHHFFEQLYPRLCYFARGILQKNIQADDVIQDVFMKLYYHMDPLNQHLEIAGLHARHFNNISVTVTGTQLNMKACSDERYIIHRK